MKKTVLLFLNLLLIFSISVNAQKDTLTGWTFPNGDIADTIAEISTSKNVNASIKAVGTAGIQMKNGNTTSAAQAESWENGNSLKYWQTTINTTDYDSILIYSLQTSGGNKPGPRDFAIVYSIGDTEKWTKLAGSDIQVQNDWTSGVIMGLVFPPECSNIEELHIKWTMTSDTASDGSLVKSSGTSKIDDIFILGHKIPSSIKEVKESVKVYPNPVNNIIQLEGIKSISIYTVNGQLVDNASFSSRSNTFDMSSIESGFYLLQIITFDNKIENRKIFKQ